MFTFQGFSSEVQVVANLLAIDGFNLPDVIALNAASASLAFSNIPWNGPVGAVRVGHTPENGFIVNPTRQELTNSSLNLVLTGTRANQAVMLEAEASNFDQILFAEAIEFGLENCAKIANAIYESQISNAIEKRKVHISKERSQESIDKIQNEMESLCLQKLRGIYSDFSHDKHSRDKAISNLAKKTISELNQVGGSTELFSEVFTKLCRNVVAEMAIDNEIRVDGRKLNQLRNISCEVDLHEPLHGSALFQRGQTQVMCTVALDSLDSALKTDAISALMG